MKAIAYRFRDWMRKYRPDGKGRIVVGGYSVGQCGELVPEDTKEITFTEVVCDFCNAEIPPTDGEGRESTVYVSDNNALCAQCASQSKE